MSKFRMGERRHELLGEVFALVDHCLCAADSYRERRVDLTCDSLSEQYRAASLQRRCGY